MNEVEKPLGLVLGGISKVCDRFMDYHETIPAEEWNNYQQCLAYEIEMLEKVVGGLKSRDQVALWRENSAAADLREKFRFVNDGIKV